MASMERCKERGKELMPTQHYQYRRTAHSMSSSSLQRKRSDQLMESKAGSFLPLRRGLLADLHVVFLGTKLFPLFPAALLALMASYFHFGVVWVFASSMVGLAPLAERVSFLSEQIAYYAGPTVGGLMNATCGNAPELVIALLALQRSKLEVLKWSLLGSILSNLLLVLGSSLLCGGIANYTKERLFDRRQADVNISLLLLSAACHILVFTYKFSVRFGEYESKDVTAVGLSRACSVVMLVAYGGCLLFQLKTHRQLSEIQENESDGDDDSVLDTPEIGFASAFSWLVAMTAVIAILSDYVVGTIEATSESWGISVGFISVILLPIVGNAAEHAGAIIFAFRNKIDIALGVTLGSSTQISMFVIPLNVIVAWMMGIEMDLDFKLLETVSYFLAIVITAFTLQDGTWHYMKGSILLLCYIVIGACFFILRSSLDQGGFIDLDTKKILTHKMIMRA